MTDGMTYAPGTKTGFTGWGLTQTTTAAFNVTVCACDAYYNTINTTNTLQSSFPDVSISCGVDFSVTPTSVDMSLGPISTTVFSMTIYPPADQSGNYPLTLTDTGGKSATRSLFFGSKSDFYIWAVIPPAAIAGVTFTAGVVISHDPPPDPLVVAGAVNGVSDLVKITPIDALTNGDLEGVTCTPSQKNMINGTNNYQVVYNKRTMIKIIPDDLDPIRTIKNFNQQSRYSNAVQIFAAAPATYTAALASAKVSRNQQSAVAVAVYDAFGNPVSNTAVNFTISGKGFFASSNTFTAQATTDYYGSAAAAFASADYTRSTISVSVAGIATGIAPLHIEVGDVLDTSKIKNTPNPFIPGKESTVIGYYLGSDSKVDMDMYSVTGSKVWSRSIAKGDPAGGQAGYNQVSWDGVTGRGMLVPFGLYILKVKVDGAAGKYTLTRKIAVKK
jgi:hypothetical protein